MSETYDIAIIGGGIQGCGIAQAAAAAGYRTVVCEKTALAHGTSSRSSKLIHGGLRYLETAQFGLVRESLRERERLIKNAAPLVHYRRFYIPVYKQTSRRPWKVFLGLSIYAMLGGFRPQACFRRVPVSEWSQLDGINAHGLQTVFQYWDAQTDDAQLTRAVMRSAQQLGAELYCPAALTMIQFDGEQYRLSCQHNDSTLSITARTVVNAAGPWVDHVHACVQPQSDFPAIERISGTHIVLEHAAPHGMYYVESPTDGRAVFIMPWQGKTLVGTTEHVFHGDPEQVQATDNDVEYLFTIARHYFPHIKENISARFAGLRVLPVGEQTVFHRSRETLLYTHDDLPGYLAVIGGKLTGYRASAEKALVRLRSRLPARESRADTRRLLLPPA